MTSLRAFSCLAAALATPLAMAMPTAKTLPTGYTTNNVNSEQHFWNSLGLNNEQSDTLLLQVSSQGMPFNLFPLFNTSPAAQASDQAQLPRTGPLPKLKADMKISFNEADLQNPEDWKSLFDVVVVIDKGVKKQNARIYRYGKLEKQVPVSTGREKVEFANPDESQSHSLTHDTTSQTFTGFYSPTVLDIDHVSEAYRDSSMPWAVFFNAPEGEATHRSPYEDLSRGVVDHNLGHRASGGCVRMHEGDSRDLFWMVRFTGTEFLPRETGNRHFMSEASRYLKSGSKVLDVAPMIPKFSVTGVVQVDPETGKPVMIPGKFKTLYVILNSDLMDAPVVKKSPKVPGANATPVAPKRANPKQAGAPLNLKPTTN